MYALFLTLENKVVALLSKNQLFLVFVLFMFVCFFIHVCLNFYWHNNDHLFLHVLPYLRKTKSIFQHLSLIQLKKK